MRVFVLGGTGSIGSAIVRELVGRGHEVHGLARSDVSAKKLAALGAAPIAGDIALPEQWVGTLPHADAVIHAACDFSSAMDEIDRRLLDMLLTALAAQPKKPRFIYTGGCWAVRRDRRRCRDRRDAIPPAARLRLDGAEPAARTRRA